ncbi:hypothetical protein ACFL2U_03150 [Patescibacteria group bacterium]
MTEKITQLPESGEKKIPKELKDKILNQEILEAKDIGLVTAVALRLTAERFLNNQGEGVPDFALRNPAVLLESITETHFDELSEGIKNKINLAGGVSKALLNSHYGASASENMPHAGSDREYRRDISGPILGLQTLVNMRDIDDIDQRYIGLVVKELSEVFEDLWKHGMENEWNEMTDEGKLRYASNNASASVNFEHDQ